MQKISIMIISILMPIVGYCASMCTPANTYVAVLSYEYDGTESTYDTDGNWTVTFDYTTYGLNSTTGNTVRGVSSCNEVPGTLNSVAGYISASTLDSGKYCWCEMTKPLISEWAFIHEYADASSCAQSCTGLCANNVKTVSALRAAIYGSVW